MDGFVFAAVLFGAASHATWNAFLKTKHDPLMMVALIALGSAACSLPFIPYLGLPAREALPWLGASVAIHVVYMISLTSAYRHGDMSQVYPLARGTAPLLTALASVLLIGEALSPAAWAGILVLGLGISVLSVAGRSGVSPLAARLALATAVSIAAYTFVDGMGARSGNDPHSYTTWMFFLMGVAIGGVVWWRRPTAFPVFLARQWRLGLLGGALSLLSYWIAIWAMTRAPIALVAAVRETSVLFAILISIIVLKEKVTHRRIAAVLIMLSGLVVMRMA